MRRGGAEVTGALIALLAVLGLAGCGSAPTWEGRPVTAPSSASAPGNALLAPLDAPYPRRPGYNHPGWSPVYGSCDTREVILEFSAGPKAEDLDHDGCKDDAPFVDVYSGAVITPLVSQIDHVWPLRVVWDRAGWNWDHNKWIQFVNYRPNLIATIAHTNESKGDSMPGQWQPSSPTGRCAYEIIIELVARQWALPLTPSETRALEALKPACKKGGN